MQLRRAGLKAKPRKCHLGLTETKYLGYKIGRGLIMPQERKIEAVRKFPRPTNKTQVRAFLELAGYYRCFIPSFSSIASPLSDLTKKGQPEKMNWTSEAEQAFQTLKKALTSSSFTDQGWTGASRSLHQPQALPHRNKVCGARKGGPGHKVGSPGAEVLPLGPPLHPCYGPRTATVDVKGEGYQRPSDAVVPGAPGLSLPGATSRRGRPQE